MSDGGSAFPMPINSDSLSWEVQSGMTLRDYFAAKAMAALIVLNPASVNIAQNAYLIADDMLLMKAAK